MKYVRENIDSAPSVVNESLNQLLNLSKQEIANAFDSMILALNSRELLIEKRIQE